MASVEIISPYKKTTVEELKPGETFEYKTKLFMKIGSVETDEDSFYNAVNMETGQLAQFELNTEVTKTSSKIITYYA